MAIVIAILPKKIRMFAKRLAKMKEKPCLMFIRKPDQAEAQKESPERAMYAKADLLM